MVGYTYNEWGAVTSGNTSHGSTGNGGGYYSTPFQYNGEALDISTSLQYLRARYYDPGTKRFLQQDTVWGKINVPLSQNLYAYVQNSPLNFVDPSGHYLEEKQTYLNRIAEANDQISSLQAMMNNGASLTTRSAIQDEISRLNNVLDESRRTLAVIEGQMSYQQAFPKYAQMMAEAGSGSVRPGCEVNPSLRNLDPWQWAFDDIYKDNWWWMNSVLVFYDAGADLYHTINGTKEAFDADPNWKTGTLWALDSLTMHMVPLAEHYLVEPNVDRFNAWINDPLNNKKFSNLWSMGITDMVTGVFVPPEGKTVEEWYGSKEWYGDLYGTALLTYGAYKGIKALNAESATSLPNQSKADFYVGPDGNVATSLSEYDWYTKNMGNPVAVAGKGHTGRTLPNNLNEQIAMYQVQSDPLNGAVDLSKVSSKPITMTDPRWPASDGWVKMSNNVDGIEIHFLYNQQTGAFDDFKFKN